MKSMYSTLFQRRCTLPYRVCSGNLKQQSRSVFVVRPDLDKNFSNKLRNREKLRKFVDIDNEKKAKIKEQDYQNRLKELKALTENVYQLIRDGHGSEVAAKSSAKSRVSSKKALQSGKGEAFSAEKIKEVDTPTKIDPKDHSLVVSDVDMPDSITKRLGLAVKYLVSKKHQDWHMVFYQLSLSGGLKDLPHKDVRKLLYITPKEAIPSLIPLIEKQLEEAGLERTSKIINVFIQGLASGRSVSDKNMFLIERYCDALSKNRKGKLPRETYELLVEAYGKNGNLEKINRTLSEMKSYKLELSRKTFADILSTSVYKLRDHNQAVSIFDSMKFFSNKTRPGTREYQDVIVSYVNKNDIEKALDLFQDMNSEGISANEKIMVALARGCALREELRVKAWDFIFAIYECGWDPSLQTMEYILYLASKDGDLSLARAIYSKLNESNSITVKSFNFLLLAYSKSEVGQNNKLIQLPSISAHEMGRTFRRNLINSINFDYASLPAEQKIPFLPLTDLINVKEILSEATAIWKHAISFRPHLINVNTVTTYLNISAIMGSLEDFIDRYESFTYFDRTGLANIHIQSSKESVDSDLIEPKVNTVGPNQDVFVPELHNMFSSKESKREKYTVPRSSLIYVIALKAAAKSRNYQFANNIWTERGLYRKTKNFKELSRETKDELDFQFAAAMISCLTQMHLLEDALALLVSTEYQFKWTWAQLKQLYRAAEIVGHDVICRTIKGIIQRAQINFSGKIRKKDFKRYIMQRGH